MMRVGAKTGTVVAAEGCLKAGRVAVKLAAAGAVLVARKFIHSAGGWMADY